MVTKRGSFFPEFSRLTYRVAQDGATYGHLRPVPCRRTGGKGGRLASRCERPARIPRRHGVRTLTMVSSSVPMLTAGDPSSRSDPEEVFGIEPSPPSTSAGPPPGLFVPPTRKGDLRSSAHSLRSSLIRTVFFRSNVQTSHYTCRLPVPCAGVARDLQRRDPRFTAHPYEFEFELLRALQASGVRFAPTTLRHAWRGQASLVAQ